MSRLLVLFTLLVTLSILAASPIVLKGNSPSGDTVIAISSSDPNVEKYLTLNFSNNSENVEEASVVRNPQTLSIGHSGLGFNVGPNWVRGVESHEPNYNGNGEIKTVTTINDNGHVYGKVKTVTFDNAKNSQ
ncbi:hypothetical protein MSG28_010713 [Choristoneura fumiferana]|uniref:Uncharacterized protein n=1 Tax=Choristoneura fumiferana TaxID=7141 RepID=A0ACC0KNZ4_CHOFU|nr:hypothetical protein MSG28_010713 [Choristoneura fumiferana]